MHSVLVTGGAGYIGSHTGKALARAGFEPNTVDNLSTGHAWAVQGRPLLVADINDTRTLADAMWAYGVKVVIHFAGSAYVGESMSNPGAYFENNVVQSLGLLEAMRKAGVDKIVFSSSCATYGPAKRLPITEWHEQSPCSPYGESKLFVEKALKWYEHAHGLKWVALRYFNAAGADPDGELGEEHHPETHVIPLAIQAAIGHRKYFELYGTNYDTHDGTAVRDYVHVADLAQAHVLACRYLLEGKASRAFNLGNGRPNSVREVLRCVEWIAGRRVPVREMPPRAGDPPALVASADLAKRVLGWRPEFEDLQSMVRTAFRWQTSESAVRLRRPTEVKTLPYAEVAGD